MDRSKVVAIITGAVSILLAIAYLVIVLLLDSRGEMLPAPQSYVPQQIEMVAMVNSMVSEPWLSDSSTTSHLFPPASLSALSEV